ncbi:putative hsp90-like protein [Erysiphe necator]|uniref:histidine kinase n=1 Tax=Uncinula necator TaxID=52586 RepID=A0A0B1PBJ6_UNCNE|nr:putative hsp90-like protein [Erysiphe necator]
MISGIRAGMLSSPKELPESKSSSFKTRQQSSHESSTAYSLQHGRDSILSLDATPSHLSKNLDTQSSDESQVEKLRDANNSGLCPQSSSHSTTSPVIPTEKYVRKGTLFEMPLNTSAAEVERLRAAMNVQLLRNQKRRKPAEQLGDPKNKDATENKVIDDTGSLKYTVDEIMRSPTSESIFTSPKILGPETTSTDSTSKISQAGTSTPRAEALQTPSYPFPSMRPSYYSKCSHEPFTKLSPTTNPLKNGLKSPKSDLKDRVSFSNTVNTSEIQFYPTGASRNCNESIFESPNLYELSLMLSSESGLEAWWETLVDILKNIYGAHRATLSVPADSTDIENVPWGQKATFNMTKSDKMRNKHSPRRSSNLSNRLTTQEDPSKERKSSKDDFGIFMSNNTRPGLQSRHSFTTYEDTKQDYISNLEANQASFSRPNLMSKTKSQFPTYTEFPPRTRTLQNAQLNLKSFEDHLVPKITQLSKPLACSEKSDRDSTGCVFTFLQALDHEIDPLIDNKGISRVLQREKVIALTRDYPYVSSSISNENSGGKKNRRNSKSRCSGTESFRTRSSEIGSKNSFFGQKKNRYYHAGSYSQTASLDTNLSDSSRLDFEFEPEQELEYDDYEQAPASPWSQSPAPSPAVHTETSDNLFFTDMQAVDEDSFNPQSTSPNYNEGPLPETIGADRSWTILHVPLNHPLLSKPVKSFRLDAAALESKSTCLFKDHRSIDGDDDRQPSSFMEKKGKIPIAILSLLSPLIPYPSNLRDSLQDLAPHIATTFSLCRQLSNLQIEISGLSRKRPSTMGFGAVISGVLQNDTEDPLGLDHTINSQYYDGVQNRFTAGSLTSPSDYSGISKSNNGSPVVTPCCDFGNSGPLQDKTSNVGSPSYIAAESYFMNRSRCGLGKVDDGKTELGSNPKTWNCLKDSASADSRVQRAVRDVEDNTCDKKAFSGHLDKKFNGQSSYEKNNPVDQGIRQVNSNTSGAQDSSPCHPQSIDNVLQRKPALQSNSHQPLVRVDRPLSIHSLLHSYGADFGSTFQSLPATSRCRISAKPKAYNCFNPAVDTSSAGFMPPPSDRVKGILLDSLPLHLFIAMPPTGEIVWVNSRYLTYRGQSIESLHINPWSSLHTSDRDAYLKSWKHSLRTGEQFAMQARLRRFDGSYRWFYTRASGLRDSRGVVVQWHGTSMDIHEQHVAEVKAARQEEIEVSEAKHRRLANLIPQIIFSATEEDGITFANHQWLSFTGQHFDDSIGLGFIDFIHPDDLAKCHLLIKEGPLLSQPGLSKSSTLPQLISSPTNFQNEASLTSIEPTVTESKQEIVKHKHISLSRTSSSFNLSDYEFPSEEFAELARSGVVKIEKDNDGQLSYCTEVRLRSKSGEYRWHLVRCVEVDDIKFGNGNSSWFGACADINDQKLLEMKLKEAMESKSKFLSNMSHEIRTPLIGISGMIDFLLDTVLNDEQLDYCNTISSSAQGLLAIINDILDLAKADAGMIKLVYSWFHVRSLVEEVNETLSTMAITKHLEVNYVVDVDVPEMVKGDRFRIRQALLNVIGNAIKFTTVGEVFTRCRIAPFEEQKYNTDENKIMLEFSITDTGKGFSQEEAEIIFNPFSQIDSSTTRSQGGTGLGLVISRQLVELHGGKMEGTAILGEGSTFTFTVVCGLPTTDDRPESPSALKPCSLVSSIPSNITPARTTALCKDPNSFYYTNREKIGAKKQCYSLTKIGLQSDPTFGSPESSSSTCQTKSIFSEKSMVNVNSSNSSTINTLSDKGNFMSPNHLDPTELKLQIPTNHTMMLTPSKSLINEKISQENPSRSLQRSIHENKIEKKHAYLPMYSILLICPQMYSREATTQHIEMTLSKDVPHQIISLSSVEEAQVKFSGANIVQFTHIVLNLNSTDELVNLIDQILSFDYAVTSIVILTDPLQRQSVIKRAKRYDYVQLIKQNRITFIFKPVKPSRFAIIFDPEKERDLSTDRNRSIAEQQVATQRQYYVNIGKRLGNKGLRVLVVEDNATNQKVLLKFLAKVGIDVDLAHDGLECTEKVFGNSHCYYSLILCDLQMPNKDGYQACREVRAWEKKRNYKKIPIVALSANVMTDVVDRCNEAGFSNYITKPVDFKALSIVMCDYLDPEVCSAV